MGRFPPVGGQSTEPMPVALLMISLSGPQGIELDMAHAFWE